MKPHRRSAQTWRQFLDAQAKTILAAELFHVDIVLPRRRPVLFFLEHGTRRVPLAGITAHPTGEWVTQQARNLVMNLGDQADGRKFLTREPDATFTAASGAVFTAPGMRILQAPARAPRATATAERWIGSARPECLDRMLITTERHLQLVLRVCRATPTSIDRTGRGRRTRPPGAHSHPATRPGCAFCAGTGSAA